MNFCEYWFIISLYISLEGSNDKQCFDRPPPTKLDIYTGW